MMLTVVILCVTIPFDIICKIGGDKMARYTIDLSLEVPVGTECELILPSGETHTLKSGTYTF